MIDLFCTNGSSPPRNSIRSPRLDLRISGGGTIFLVDAVSPAGHAWIDEHISPDASRLGTAIAVEHPFIHDLVGAIRDGLEVQ